MILKRKQLEKAIEKFTKERGLLSEWEEFEEDYIKQLQDKENFTDSLG